MGCCFRYGRKGRTAPLTKDRDQVTEALAAAAGFIEESVLGESPEQVGELEERAISLLPQSPTIALFILGSDSTLAADVRGVATRLFAEHADWDDRYACELAMELASSGQALVRLGLVLGLEDGDNQELLARLSQDPHSRVRQEAERLRASAGFLHFSIIKNSASGL